MSRPPTWNPAETREAYWRTLLTFALTRIAIAFILLLYLMFNREQASIAREFSDYWQTCVFYLLAAIAFAALAARYRRHLAMHAWAQLACDLAVISILYSIAGGARSGLAILYLFPLAGGAILTPLLPALFFAAVATIFVLIEDLYRILALDSGASISQSGLYGAAFFATVVVVNRLAARLIREEALARQRGHALRLQEAVNRLVIADMGDGILVIGPEEEILTANPAAERMLGLDVPYTDPFCRLSDVPALAPIAEAFSLWHARTHEGGGGAPMYVVIKPEDGSATHGYLPAAHLQLRFAHVDIGGPKDQRTVIFLQDVTEIENKAQQLKLASMGRLTASIAHEVRNPLSAIGHAASLLAEEEATPLQARLLHIVGDNVARLNRMIEDILKLSRKAQPQYEPLPLGPFLEELVDEFCDLHAVPAGMIDIGRMAGCQVWFDPLHLREIVTNLLSNALRYASGKPGSIRLYVGHGAAGRLELHVQDDGPPISPEVRAHLFEPFYTTSSKGTGLGLYLARELCLNNGALIDYEHRADTVEQCGEQRGDGGGRFVITFAAVDVPVGVLPQDSENP